MENIPGNLVDEIELTNDNLDQLQTSYNEKLMILNRMLEEKEILHQTFIEEAIKLQGAARGHVQMVLAELEICNMELENKKERLNSWSKELDEREAERERQILGEHLP